MKQKLMKPTIPTVEAQMLIRKSAGDVFEAFVNPDITKNFWFTDSTGRLEEGATVTWTWEMYGVSAEVKVLQIIPQEKIVVEWGSPATTVEFLLFAQEAGTYVVIKNYGFYQTGDELIEIIIDQTGGFTTVLDGLKAYLELGLQLNLIRDKFPNKN